MSKSIKLITVAGLLAVLAACQAPMEEMAPEPISEEPMEMTKHG
ncbi:MAG: hypothetical protein OXE94_12895 [Aestuariivita sp.]|nr:hypothetical protein [Aestuariivita sp.]MCY4203227.1 hypothetical protein [Aestuariivita sp.]MCY4287570.1 hypothetical protein [Aestuariivita sp.]MCY4346060.1 hypothetical protein [Aestuariivita sp.]